MEHPFNFRNTYSIHPTSNGFFHVLSLVFLLNQYILPVLGSLADFQMADPPPPRDDAVLPAGEADRICAELAPGLLLLQLTEPLDLLVVLPDREGGSPVAVELAAARCGGAVQVLLPRLRL